MWRDILFFFPGLLLFLFAPAFFGSVFFNERLEKLFLPGLILNSMLFYLAAVFHLSEIFFPLQYAINLLLYIPAVKKIRQCGLQQVSDFLISPGAVLLVTAISVVFFTTITLRFETWDAISHWGKAVKLFLSEGMLGCEYPKNILLHASYPPGLCMTSAMLNKCFFTLPFTEGIVIFSHLLFDIGALVYLVSFFSWNQKNKLLFALLTACCVLPGLYYFDCFELAYTDSELSFLMAVVFFQMATIQKFRKIEIAGIALMLSWLFMIRNAGWGYAMALLVMFAIIIIQKRKQAFYRSETNTISKGKTALLATVFMLPIIIKLSWSIQLRYYNTPLRFGGANINIDNVCDFLLSDRGMTTAKNFFWALTENGFTAAFIILIASAFIALKYVNDKQFRYAICCLLCFFIPGFIIFLATMLIYYGLEFGITPDSFPSLVRYTSSYLMMPFFVLILLLFKKTAEVNKQNNSDVMVSRKYVLFLLIILSLFCAALSKPFSDDTYAFRRMRRECDKVIAYEKVFAGTDKKFTLICDKGYEFKDFYMSYLYPENFKPQIYGEPVLPGSSKAEEGGFVTAITVDELKKQLAENDYVMFDLRDEKSLFPQNYQAIFVSGTKCDFDAINGKLFEVTSYGLRLVQ